LSKHVPTVAVLSTYPTHPSPAQNRDLAEEILASGGAVISESFGSAPTPALLQARNRIIAGLASVTIPAEAGLNSGTMGTVAAALEAGRAVVVPLPKPSARMLPGAEALLALAGITEMPRKSLKVTNATFERLKISGFANAVADTPAALTELIVLAHRFSPYLDPATLI
jgi:hypothetical protein